MKEVIKISVIVPVYNGEKHIATAIESLLSQTLENIEIIVVNDGSTDATLHVLEPYQTDARIKIISQKNQGVSQARNTGIENARGEYIGFLDADDIHQPQHYEKLWRVIDKNNIDIVASNVYLERDNKLILKQSGFERNAPYCKNEIKEILIPYLLKIENPVFLSVCNKIFKRELLNKKNIRFNTEISLEEDTLFNLSVMAKAESMVFISFAGNYHQENAESTTRNFLKNDIFEKVIEKYNLNYNRLVGLNIPEEVLSTYQSSRLIHSVCMLFFKCATNIFLSKKEKQQFVEKILSHPNIVFSSNNLHSDYYEKTGKFEKLLIWIIKNKKIGMGQFLNFLISKIYSPRLSEVLRKINAKI